MKWLKRIAFSILPAVVLLGAMETALRAAGWPKQDSRRKFTHSEVYWVEAASLRKEAYSHQETGGSFRVSTDASGLRAPLHTEEKPEGSFRVMTLGCSTTFGWGVEDEESYPYQLEQLLKAEHPTVEVINGGQPGHSSFQGLWLWDKALARYKPDLVLFGYIVQDSRMVAYSDLSQAILQKNSEFLKKNLLYQAHVYMGLRQLLGDIQIEMKDEKQTSYRVPLPEYVENIRSFKAKIEGAGAKMVLFGFPLERNGYTAAHRTILHAAADELKLPLIDPQPEFERMPASQGWYFPKDKGHANAEGNKAIAERVAAFLIENKLVP